MLGLLLAAVHGSAGRAADEIPVRNISGALCIKGVLRTAKAKTPAFVVLDLGTRGPLLLHPQTAGVLGIEKRGPVDLVVDGSNYVFVGIQAVAQPLEPLETLTREHAQALDDIPAVAVLGMPAFAGKLVELDVGAGRLRLAPRGGSDLGVRGASSESKTTTLNYKGEAYGYWLEAEVPATPAAAKLRVRLATSEYDTRIDAKVADRLGSPGGDLARLMLGPVNVAEYTVLRPSDLSGFPEPRPDVVLGTHLLSSFLLIVDPDQQQLTLAPVHPPQLALEERQFFVAAARANAADVEAFLDAHPESRLAPEASEVLLNLRLAEGTADRKAIERALTRRAQTAKPERRAMTMVQAADELIAEEKQRRDAYDLAAIALDVGKPYAADDLNATAIHHINARRGLIALMRKDYTQARRDLLSAAFGIPKDPYVNLWLGQLYERTNQLPRAWSRYLQASLRDQPPIGALRGLDRLNRDPAFRNRFTMTDAERLLEGRVPAFVPTRRYQPAAGGETPVDLVESFINQYDPATQAAQLALDGLGEYLALAGTVFVQYHVGDLLSADESAARAAYYGAERVPAVYFDGIGPVSDGGDEKAASRVFAVYRQRCIQGAKTSKTPALRGSAVWQADNVRVHVQINPGEEENRPVLHALLCERLVMAIGTNAQVLHRHVVRAGLTLADGKPLDLSRGPQTFDAEVGLWATRQRLEQRLDELAKKAGGPPPMRPTWIDRKACDVVVFLQDPVTRRVLAAIVLPVKAEADKET